MHLAQTGILADLPKMSRYLFFAIDAVTEIQDALQSLRDNIDSHNTVIGIGPSLTNCLEVNIPGLHPFPVMQGGGIDIPSTPTALWCWLQGEDRGELFHRSREIEAMLAPGFALEAVIDSFIYDGSRDLSGYEDGTENPQGDDAIAAAIVQNQGPGLDGSSFVAVQQWRHEFDLFSMMTTDEQDNVIGRHIADNEEFDEAPSSAHVKRAAQESYEPEAFILRRSMPWTEGMDAGLVFVAFGKSFDAFETILNRMLGNEDGIVDGLFSFTQPINSAYYWCPPVKAGKLDLSKLGL